MSFTTFKWEISDKKYLSFVNAKHQQEFSSSLFEVDNIKFYLKCYPNGRKKAGLVNLYLTLSEEHFPSNIAKLKINYWIFCAETHSRVNDIRDFSSDDNNSFHGWSTNTLNLKELENNSVHNITFTVGVNILKIYFKNEVAKGSDNKLVIYEKPFKMLPRNSFHWNINEFMFQSFLSAPNKKCWESEQFDQWALGCYPNGHTKNDKGNAMLYLKCLGLPPQIYGVKIRYTLFCPQTNLKWSYVQNYNYANTNYANATFKTSTLHSLKSLSFQITINVLKLYDLNRKEVPYRNVSEYLFQVKQTNNNNNNNNNNNMDDEKKKSDAHARDDSKTDKTDLSQQETEEKPLIPNFDIVGTIQGIKDKLIGVTATADVAVHNDNYCEISSVQEQVEIYSKELQSMNRQIYLIRKQCNDVNEKQIKNNTSFQTVLKQVKMIKNDMNEMKNNHHDKDVDTPQNETKNENEKENENIKLQHLENEVMGLKNKLNEEKDSKQELKVEMETLKTEYNALMEEIINLKNEMHEMKKENEEINKIKSNFSLINITNDENKTNDDLESEKDKEKIKEMKEWVFTKLEFNSNVLNSIWNKLLNDGFDDISLLSELNDDTLKNMGIHRVGDRIKILRACKLLR